MNRRSFIGQIIRAASAPLILPNAGHLWARRRIIPVHLEVTPVHAFFFGTKLQDPTSWSDLPEIKAIAFRVHDFYGFMQSIGHPLKSSPGEIPVNATPTEELERLYR